MNDRNKLENVKDLISFARKRIASGSSCRDYEHAYSMLNRAEDELMAILYPPKRQANSKRPEAW